MDTRIELNYSLSLEDFLTFNLYKASKSPSVIKKRKRNRFIFPVLYIVYGLFLTYKDDTLLGILLFSALAILWVIFYPVYEKWRYKNHFQNHVKENYGNSIETRSCVKFKDSIVRVESKQSNFEANYSEFQELVEIDNLYFLIFKNGTALIVKKSSVPNEKDFIDYLISKSITYSCKVDWEWK